MDDRFHGVLWSRLDPPGDSLGVSCDADGPSIGPVRLLKRMARGLEPRSVGELEFVLGQATGRPIAMSEKMSGLRAVANALEKGDLARAMMVTQFMWLPSLGGDSAFRRAIRADALVKAGFDPNQPRDDDGRWSADGSSEGVADPNWIPVQEVLPNTLVPWMDQILPVEPEAPTPIFPGDILPPTVGSPDIAVPRTLENPFPNDRGCAQEWDAAKRYCNDLGQRGLLGRDGYRGMGGSYEQCLRGQVSERCGGNPVDPNPRPRKKPKNRSNYELVV